MAAKVIAGVFWEWIAFKTQPLKEPPTLLNRLESLGGIQSLVPPRTYIKVESTWTWIPLQEVKLPEDDSGNGLIESTPSCKTRVRLITKMETG